MYMRMPIYIYVCVHVCVCVYVYIHIKIYARGPITSCGLAAGSTVFIKVRVPNLTGTNASHYGLVDLHSSDRKYHIPLSESVTAVYPSQVVTSCTPTSRT